MAEAVGLAASILAIAGAGISITTTLYRFTKSYQHADRQVEGIATTVSVTSSILTELGNATKEHPGDLQKLNRWVLFEDTIGACKRDFDIIAAAIGLARKDGAAMQDQKKVRKDNGGKATPWQKFKWAIGEEKDIDDLLSSLERSKSNLQLLLDASNYDILRKLEKSHALNPQLAEQLAEIRAILPWIVTNILKLGYKPNQAYGPDNPLTGSKEIPSHERKPPPEGDSSVSPPQEVKDEQNGYQTGDIALTEKPSDEDRNDAPEPPKVKDSLPPSNISIEPFMEASEVHSSKNFNHVTGDQSSPAVVPKKEQSPAAASHQLDFSKYEAWSLTYRKADVKRENEYHELVLVVRPLKLKTTRVEVIPAHYHFAQLNPSESELKAAVLVKNRAVIWSNPWNPWTRVVDGLPWTTQRAVDKLLKRRKIRNARLANVKIMKQPLWERLIKWRNSHPSLIVFLECQLDISSEYSDDTDESSTSSFQCRPTRAVRKVIRRPRHFRRRSRSPGVIEYSRTSSRSPARTIRAVKTGVPERVEGDDIVEVIEEHSPPRQEKRGRSSGYRLVDPGGFAGGSRRMMSRGARGRDERSGGGGGGGGAGPTPSYPSKTSIGSGEQALPSEVEAERIMEQFLSGLTTSQDIDSG